MDVKETLDTAAQIVKDIREGLSQGRAHWFPREL